MPIGISIIGSRESERAASSMEFLEDEYVSFTDQISTRGMVIYSCFLIFVALFYMFAYNSGYGYDALEYLVIGRALSEGQPFYTLIPSKAPGIYYLVAAFFSAGFPANHYAVSAIVTLLFAATLVGTWLAVGRVSGPYMAIVATLLVAACAAFMELNFLEPENAVYLSGLAAYVLILKSETNRLRPFFAAGFVLAIGFQFKAVAAFYFLGILSFLLFEQLRSRGQFGDLVRRVSIMLAGFLMGISIPFLFFAATGRISDFWTWSIWFPLFHYPANTFWLPKLFTKLLWFHLFLIGAFLCCIFMVGVRRSILRDNAAILACFMGLASYLALFKTQSSHYCFPGAAFFSIFIAAVLLRLWKTTTSVTAPKGVALTLVAAILLTLSTILYRPQAFSRFMKWQDFHEEELIGAQITQQIPSGGKGLFVRDSTFLYWVSRVEPAARFVHFDVQTTYFVERNPDSLLRALNDQSVSVVEFDPDDPAFQDTGFGDFASRSGLLAEFTQALAEQFRPADISPAPFHFWVRKTMPQS